MVRFGSLALVESILLFGAREKLPVPALVTLEGDVVLRVVGEQLIEQVRVHVGLIESRPFHIVRDFKVGSLERIVVTWARVHDRIIDDLADVVQAQQSYILRQLDSVGEIGTRLTQGTGKANIHDAKDDSDDHGEGIRSLGDERGQRRRHRAYSGHDDDRRTGVLWGDPQFCYHVDRV